MGFFSPSSFAVGVSDLPAIFNLRSVGYYRVDYDDENWARINSLLFSNHQAIHQARRDIRNVSKWSEGSEKQFRCYKVHQTKKINGGNTHREGRKSSLEGYIFFGF